MICSPAFAGKTYGVYGLARTGKSVAAALAASDAKTLNWDDGAAARADSGLAVTDLTTARLEGLEGLVVSPGVPLNTHPLTARARQAGVPVIGDIELFALARPSLPPHKVVGITGTNGKSTTTALVHHVLRTAGVPTLMGGNIGLPILSQESLPEGGVYVLELSSYQLDLTFSLCCEVAVLLNITPDHLERHGDMIGYAGSKARLFGMQVPGETAVIGTDDRYGCDIAEQVVATLVPVSAKRIVEEGVSVTGGAAYIDGDEFASQSDWPALQGPHNAQNAAAAIAVARALGVQTADLLAGLASYPGLPHRMERVAEKHGILYVNDSKATNADSTAPALQAYPRLHWIAGGRAKEGGYETLLPHLSHVVAAYLIGEAADLFEPLLAPHIPTVRSGTLAAAVGAAAAAAQPGDTVLLSPACASFDQFRDFEARGEVFRTLVEALP